MARSSGRKSFDARNRHSSIKILSGRDLDAAAGADGEKTKTKRSLKKKFALAKRETKTERSGDGDGDNLDLTQTVSLELEGRIVNGKSVLCNPVLENRAALLCAKTVTRWHFRFDQPVHQSAGAVAFGLATRRVNLAKGFGLVDEKRPESFCSQSLAGEPQSWCVYSSSSRDETVAVCGGDSVTKYCRALGLTMDTNKFTVADGSGNTAIAGTLTTTGATALDGGLTMDTNKFTVADDSGNTAIAGTFDATGDTKLGAALGITGTLTTTGATALDGGLTMDTNKFTVADGSGNTAIAGTLTTTSATSLAGGLSVTGVGTFSVGVVSTGFSVTATVSGSGSGVISHGVNFASITSSDSDYLITLPPSSSSISSCTVGHTIKLFSTDSYQIQTSAPGSISIQGTSGASCASSVANNMLVECTCTTGTAYVCITVSTAGDVAGLQAPSCSRRRSLLTELIF